LSSHEGNSIAHHMLSIKVTLSECGRIKQSLLNLQKVHNKFGDLCETQHAAVKHKWNQFIVARLQKETLDC